MIIRSCQYSVPLATRTLHWTEHKPTNTKHIRLWTHDKHPIHGPYGRTMGHLCGWTLENCDCTIAGTHLIDNDDLDLIKKTMLPSKHNSQQSCQNTCSDYCNFYQRLALKHLTNKIFLTTEVGRKVYFDLIPNMISVNYETLTWQVSCVWTHSAYSVSQG